MAKEKLTAKESSVNPINATRSNTRQRTSSPQEIIRNFDKDYRIAAYSAKDRIPMSLSNYAFSLSQSVRSEKYPFLENVGTEDQIKAIKYVVATSVSKGANAVAKALNESRLGGRTWTVVEKSPIKLEYTDPWGNKDHMVIRKKK